jgi:hypothetical protein
LGNKQARPLHYTVRYTHRIGDDDDAHHQESSPIGHRFLRPAVPKGYWRPEKKKVQYRKKVRDRSFHAEMTRKRQSWTRDYLTAKRRALAERVLRFWQNASREK